MKKFILSVMMFVMAGTMNIFGQSQEYIDAVGELINLSIIDNFTKEEMKPQFINLLSTAGVPENAEAIVDKYLDTQFTEDIKNIMAEYYYKSITLDELNLIVEKAKDPEYNSIFKKNGIINKKMEEITQAYIMTGIMTIATGDDVPAPDLSPNMSEGYFKKVQKLNKATNAISLIDNSKKGIIEAIESQIEDEDSKSQFRTIMNKCFDIFTKNYDRLSAEAYFVTLTEEELTKYIDYCDTPAGKAHSKAATAFTEDIIGAGMKVLENFNNWYEKQKYIKRI